MASRSHCSPSDRGKRSEIRVSSRRRKDMLGRRSAGAAGRPPVTWLDDLRLKDHHCHGVVNTDLDQAAFEGLISESFHPAPPGGSPLRFADRPRNPPVVCPCAGTRAVRAARRLRRTMPGSRGRGRGPSVPREAGLGALLIDTGYRSDELHDLTGMRELAGVPVHEIVRLEAVAEAVAGSGSSPGSRST